MKLRVSLLAPPFQPRSFLLLALLLATSTFAQERGFRAHRYDGSAAGSWLFLLERPWYSVMRVAAVGVTADYSRNALIPSVATGRGGITPILENALVGHVDLAGSLFDRVRLSGSLPVTFLETGTAEAVSGVGPLKTIGIGDPKLQAMVRLFGQPERDAFSLHLGADVWVPIGAAATHQGDTGVRFQPRAVLAGAFGAGRWTVDLGYLHRPSASIGTPALGMVAAPEVRAGVALGASLVKDSLYLGPEAQFSMQVVGVNAFTPAGMNLELLGGLHYLIADTVLVGLAGGTSLFGAAGSPDARAMVRIAWAPRRDSDDDGVPNLDDECPDARGVKRGCPEPVADDADLDQVPDALDRCPFEPETRNGLRDEDGCPEYEQQGGGALARLLAPAAGVVSADGGVASTRDARSASTSDAGAVAASVVPSDPVPAPTRDGGSLATAAALVSTKDAGPLATSVGLRDDAGAFVAALTSSGESADGGTVAVSALTPRLELPVMFAAGDSDGDGVIDDDDRCPVTPEDLDGFEDEDGCPELDNDQDGLADAVDRCSAEAESINGEQDDDGCPDVAPDADADGVADAVDRCPFEPETIDGVRDQDGCPEAPVPAQAALSKILAPPPLPITLAAVSTDPSKAPAPADADKDGVLDDDDRCPVSAEDRDGFEDDDGCAELDNDDDGIADAKDKCPDVAETLNGWQDDDGCADEHPDVDGDGVEYVVDRCPLEPGDPSDGCPHAPLPALAVPGFALPLVAGATPLVNAPSIIAAAKTADFDKDTTPDDADACPVTPEDKDGFEDEDGCPEPDNDLDGVDDKADKCPYEAETINGVKDEDGCPDLGDALVHVTRTSVVIDRVVQFKPGSVTLQPASNSLLTQVAQTLKAASTLSVEIQGHTDDTGNALTNIKLSQKRAETIRAFLVKAGVKGTRLVAKGYGPTKPQATNKTPEGREKNRRVEFLILGEAK